MTATSPKTPFAYPLAVYCRSIAAPMARYWRFWRAANVPPFRKLRSDYPLFFTSCNCLRQCRCAHAHRLLMSNRIVLSGASLTCASSPKLYVCTTLLALEFYLEDHQANIKLPALKFQDESCFDKQKCHIRLVESRVDGSQAAQHSCAIDCQIS